MRYLNNSDHELLHSCSCSSHSKVIFDGSILPTTPSGQNGCILFFGDSSKMNAEHDELPLRVLRAEKRDDGCKCLTVITNCAQNVRYEGYDSVSTQSSRTETQEALKYLAVYSTVPPILKEQMSLRTGMIVPAKQQKLCQRSASPQLRSPHGETFDTRLAIHALSLCLLHDILKCER